MSYLYSLLGLDTFEIIRIGYEKSIAREWGLYDHEGPVINLQILGYGKEEKRVMLPKAMLEKLYTAFAKENPTGTEVTLGEEFLLSPPPGLSKKEAEDLYNDDKLYIDIADTGSYSRYIEREGPPRICQLLPELQDMATLEQLANDPELDLSLRSQASQEGVLSNIYGPRHKRWSPEWTAYVDEYLKKHPEARRYEP